MIWFSSVEILSLHSYCHFSQLNSPLVTIRLKKHAIYPRYFHHIQLRDDLELRFQSIGVQLNKSDRRIAFQIVFFFAPAIPFAPYFSSRNARVERTSEGFDSLMQQGNWEMQILQKRKVRETSFTPTQSLAHHSRI